MPPIRVLIVDSSAVARRVLRAAIESSPGVEVVGTAVNGHDAVERIERLRPDVVTLESQMLGLPGLVALVEIRHRHPALPVIVVSAATGSGRASTLRALEQGATDFVTKPATLGDLDAAVAYFRHELVPKIRALGGQGHAAPATPPRPNAARTASARVDCVVIGVSTGGPRVLERLLPALPADFPVPVLVVQHMPASFTRLLADRLNAMSALAVAEAVHGAVPEPGTVLIAPGEHHLEVVRRTTGIRVVLHQDAPEHSCRPSVCVLFRSAARVFGANTLGVVLTGMGDDGVHGTAEIVDAGGRVIVQDEASSVVWGMPGAVVKAGLADAVLGADQVAREIRRRVAHGRSLSPSRRREAPA